MKDVPTPFGHLSDWRVDPRDPRPSARAQLMALAKKKKASR
jgi:hypothetical protein